MADQPVAPPQSIQFDAPATPTAASATPGQPPQTIQFDEPAQPGADQPDHDSVFNTDPVTGEKIANLGVGIIKGAGQAVNTISSAISKVAPSIVRPSDVAGLSTAEQPQGPDQKIGLTAENIAEFLGGDEILKGLSVGAKYAKVGKLMDLLEESPRLRRAVNLGIQSLRQGTVAGVQAAAHGATPGEAATTAAEGAGLGTAAGLATDVVGAGAGLVGKGAKRAISAFTEPAGFVVPSVPELPHVPAKAELEAANLRTIQPKFQSSIRGILNSVENTAGIKDVEGAVESPSIRDAVSDTADKFFSRAKATYADLDAATGGHFQRFANAMRDLNREMNEFITSPDEGNLAKEAELAQRRANLEAAQDAAFDRAKAQGVDPAIVESARADFKRSQALYDLDFNLKRTVKGGRPELYADPEEAAKNPERVHPDKLTDRLNAMYDSGRLQEAVGTPNAKKLLKGSEDVLMEHRDAVHAAQQAAAQRVADARDANEAQVAAARTVFEKRAAANKLIRAGVKTAAGVGLATQVLPHIPAITHIFTPGQGVRSIE